MNARNLNTKIRKTWSTRIGLLFILVAILALALAGCIQGENNIEVQSDRGPADLLDFPQVAGTSDEGRVRPVISDGLGVPSYEIIFS